MSVIVKGMKMPENCDVCRFGDWSNIHQTACCKLKDYEPCFSDYNWSFKTKRSTICPLVDLGKHGDLIDRDKVIPKLKFINEAEHQIYGRESWGFTAKCIQAFDDVPTVIEAEDGT